MYIFMMCVVCGVVDLCENGSAADAVTEHHPYTTSPSLPVACSQQG